MRTMTRNRKVFYYASLDALALGQDLDGNYTEEKYTYSDPVEARGVFTVANGRAQSMIFGMSENYDRVITLNKGEDFLKVGSILWIDTMPEINEQGHAETPHDYIVVAVSDSLNFVSVAIRKVDVA